MKTMEYEKGTVVEVIGDQIEEATRRGWLSRLIVAPTLSHRLWRYE